MIKIIAEPILGKNLKPGDLFSTADQAYWDFAFSVSSNSLGERAYIRTNTKCPKHEENEPVYKITIKETKDEI